MLFNSSQFMIFFPVVTLVYFVIPHKIRYLWLLAASYFFYMSWNPEYALLIAVSTVITFLSGLLIGRANKTEDPEKAKKQKKLYVALSFISNLAILVFFKYYHFAANSIEHLFSLIGIAATIPAFDVILPVGISFYTFQALSYTMDVYRGEIAPERNIAKYALFVSFFPQLVAGPIERSKNLLAQVHEKHTFDAERVKNGLLLMLWGLFLKVVIADRAALLVNNVFEHYTEYAGFELMIAALLFSVQIYCDFAGYSTIAIGAAEVLGFRLMVNFRQPYFASSIREFWHRWHISLSTWFRDYLYFPLGGNRKGKFRTHVNVMITFLVSGLWHGASWNYIIWGGIHGAMQVLGGITKPVRDWAKRVLGVRDQCGSYKLFQKLLTFTVVTVSWVFFRAPGTRAALDIFRRMFTGPGPLDFFGRHPVYPGAGRQGFLRAGHRVRAAVRRRYSARAQHQDPGNADEAESRVPLDSLLFDHFRPSDLRHLRRCVQRQRLHLFPVLGLDPHPAGACFPAYNALDCIPQAELRRAARPIGSPALIARAHQ